MGRLLDFGLFRDLKRVIHLDSEIQDGTFQLGMTKLPLGSAPCYVRNRAGFLIAQGRLVADNVEGVLGGAIKSLIAGAAAAVASLIAAFQPDANLSTSEYLVAASAAIVVWVGTYQIPDPPSPDG